jgi:hypothetical protein
MAEDGASQIVTTQVGGEAQAVVGFLRVRALVLQLVSAELVEQTDAASLLHFVNQKARSGDCYLFDRHLDLFASIYAKAMKNIDCESM